MSARGKAFAIYKPVGSVYAASALFQHRVEPEIPILNPATMSTADRLAMLQRVQAREVLALRAAIKVFGESKNANGLRPRPGSTHELAVIPKELPFIQVHNMRDTEGRHGALLDSKFVDSEVIDLVEFRRIPSMEAFLLGNLGEFSIGYGFHHAECSFCGTEADFFMNMAFPACGCPTGTEFERDGETFFVELWTDQNIREELSTVNRGAFPNTEIRSAFDAAQGAACFSFAPPPHLRNHEDTMPDRKPAESGQAAPKAEEPQGNTTPPTPAPASTQHAAPQPTVVVVNTNDAHEPVSVQMSEIDTLREQLKASREATFTTIFNDAAKRFLVKPAHRETHKGFFFDSFNGDAAQYQAYLNTLEPNAAFGTTPIGVGSTEMSGTGTPPSKAKMGKAELIGEYAVKLGFTKPETFKKKFGKDPVSAAPRDPLSALGVRR